MILDESLTEPRTLQFGRRVREMKAAGREMISLGLGEPDFDTPEHVKEAAVEALRAGLTRYSEAAGLPELRELIARKLRSDNGIEAEPDEILITPGAKNALFLACCALLRPGDEAINFTPCYVSNHPILKLAEPQVVVHHVRLTPGEFRVDRDRVRSLVNERTKLIFISYPNNPTGKMLDRDDSEFIRGLAREHSLHLLSDEIYDLLPLTGKPHISPAASADIREQVVTVNGFSKAYAMTGWRIGYAHAPRPVLTLMTRIHEHLNTNTAAFVQKAAVAALTGPQGHLKEFIARLKRNAGRLEAFLAARPRLRSAPVEGGFFAFVDISATGLASDHFCTRLLEETGVVIIPGIAFGDDFDGWVRVSLAVSEEAFVTGLSRIGQFVERAGKEPGG